MPKLQKEYGKNDPIFMRKHIALCYVNTQIELALYVSGQVPL